jgi:hypothetical protein
MGMSHFHDRETERSIIFIGHDMATPDAREAGQECGQCVIGPLRRKAIYCQQFIHRL